MLHDPVPSNRPMAPPSQPPPPQSDYYGLGLSSTSSAPPHVASSSAREGELPLPPAESPLDGSFPVSRSASRDALQGTQPLKPSPRKASLPVGLGLAEGEEGEGRDRMGPKGRTASGGAKALNPLEDLIRTETMYVEDLGSVIKKVAGAWSRSNFPPPALDGMFRAVEAIYRVNKSFLAKLNVIGPSPSSPAPLGDLLMAWISTLEPSYNRYASTLQVGFDSLPDVLTNEKLHTILSALNYPGTLPPSDGPLSLDLMFTLPIYRLKYYQILYAKLLKSTQEGRKDHGLLVKACETLEKIVGVMTEGGRRTLEGMVASPVMEKGKGRTSDDSVAGSSTSDRFSNASNVSNGTAATTVPSGTTTPTMPSAAGPAIRVEELEKRLCTERAMDIFTMLPKKCRLQISPPSLQFARQLRLSSPVEISFFPLSDPQQREILIPNGYIYLLTDLFLVCELMTSSEKIARGSEAEEDRWLLYPPLAGKHLRVRDGQREGELEVTVMGKETLALRMESGVKAREWKTAFEAAIAFGNNKPLPPRAELRINTGGDGAGRPARSDSPASALQSASLAAGPLSAAIRSASSSAIPSPLSASQRDSLQGVRRASAPDQTNGVDGGERYAGANERWDDRPLPAAGDAFLPSIPLDDSFLPSIPQDQRDPRDYPDHRSSAGTLVSGPPRGSSTSVGIGEAFPSEFNNSQLRLDDYGAGSGARSNGWSAGGGYYAVPPPHSNSQSRQPSPSYDGRPLPKSPSAQSSNSQSQFYPPHLLPHSPYAKPGNSGPHSNPTSRRTDPGNELLSPVGSIHRSRSADGLRDAGRMGGMASMGSMASMGPGSYRMPSEAMAGGRDERSWSAPNSGGGGGGRRSEERVEEDDMTDEGGVKEEGPMRVVAQMRCKAFLQQNHAQWKSLGTARLKLFTNAKGNEEGRKQLVVEAEKDKKVWVSTIVLTDGVEKVGKTGVAIELSDNGSRTGIVYMLQMKTEQAAMGLFEQLLIGSGRLPNNGR